MIEKAENFNGKGVMLIMYNVGIYLFNDVELLDFAGPYEDLSLHVVGKLFGKETAVKTAVYMEYGDWDTKGLR